MATDLSGLGRAAAALMWVVLALSAARAEEPAEEGLGPRSTDEYYQGYNKTTQQIEQMIRKGAERRTHWSDVKKSMDMAVKADMARFNTKMKHDRDIIEALGMEEVHRGDVVAVAKEPRDVTDVIHKTKKEPPVANYWDKSELDFSFLHHDIWSLKPEDFRIWQPVRVMVEKPLGAREPTEERHFIKGTEKTVFRDVFWALPFALTNSTDRELLLGPRMWVVTEDLRFSPEIAGFIAQEDVENSVFRELNSSFDLIGYVKEHADRPKESVQAVAPGETRYGVGVFQLPDIEADRLTLVVEGLNNTYRFDRRQKRVLTIEFEHKGDEFYPHVEPTKYQGKDWTWMWMWYEDVHVAPPERFPIETASGLREKPKVLWAFQATLRNSTGEPQKIAVREFNTVVRLIKVPILGVKDVEVEIVDDGKSTVHKKKVMEEMAQEFQGDRFFKGTLAPEEPKVFPVIFDLDDVNWEKVYEQVERGLIWDDETGRGISIGYGEDPLKPGLESFIPDPEKLKKVRVIKLTDEQKAQVREEVTAALPATLQEERDDKRLMADVSAVAGIASGTFRIVRSYFQRGAIETEWIHKWEEGF
jgi:hypothetical protein